MTGALDCKEIPPGVTAIEAIHLITPDRKKLPPAAHLPITVQGTATIEGAIIGEKNQLPQARPTQAVCVTATMNTNVTIGHYSEWAAIHCTVEYTNSDPRASDRQTPWTTAIDRLSNITVNNTLSPQTMEPASRATQIYHRAAKHTIWHYSTTIQPEAVSQIKGALSLEPPGSQNTHQLGAFTAYQRFSTAARMLPQVAEATLPPTVRALARAVQTMARREEAPLDWTPNTLVEQCVHHNTNKAQQTERQIHPPLRDIEGNLQPHNPLIVHFILQDHRDNLKGTEIQLGHTLVL